MAPSTRSTSSAPTSAPTPITPHTPATNLPPTANPVSVLFICLGNICRSPLAEAVFRALTAFSTPNPHPLISRIDSCGTGAYHSNATPDSRTLAVLRKRAGITDYVHRARKIRVPKDLQEFDYLVVMDRENLEDVRDLVKRAGRKGELHGVVRVCLFGEFGGRGGGGGGGGSLLWWE